MSNVKDKLPPQKSFTNERQLNTYREKSIPISGSVYFRMFQHGKKRVLVNFGGIKIYIQFMYFTTI